MNYPRLLSMVLCLLLAAAPHVNAQEKTTVKEKDDRHLFWIFLTTGKSTSGVERSEIQTMQAAHLENFRRLAKIGSLLTAGLLADPEKKLRGIVVVKAEDQKELMKMFVDDPYVTQGYMKIQVGRMSIERGEFNTRVTPAEMSEYRIVILTPNAQNPPADGDGKLKNRMNSETNVRLAALFREKRLCFQAEVQLQAKVGILVFNKVDDDQLSKLMDDIPSIKNRILTWQAMPLYLGKGTFLE